MSLSDGAGTEPTRRDDLKRWGEVAIFAGGVAICTAIGMVGARHRWPPGRGIPFGVLALSAPVLLGLAYGMRRHRWPIRFGWAASIAFWMLVVWVGSSSYAIAALEPPSPPNVVDDGTGMFFGAALGVATMGLPVVVGAVMAGQALGRRLFGRGPAGAEDGGRLAG